MLSSWYRDSIKAWYVMPLDNDVHFGLRSSTAKALYGLLSYYFHCRPPQQAWVRRRYSDLCRETIITRQQYFSKGFAYLKRALNELIEKQFLAKVEAKAGSKKEKDDGWLYFWPGERVLRPELFRMDRAQLLLWEDPTEGEVLEPPTPASEPAIDQEEITALITRFYAELSGCSKSARKVSKAERQLVTEWVGQQGAECFIEFIGYALQQKKSRWPELASVTGALNAYGDEFLRRERGRREYEAEQAEGQEEAHIFETLQPDYRRYFSERLEVIKKRSPQEHAAFVRALKDNTQYAQMGKAVEEGRTEWQSSLEAIEHNIAQNFFGPRTEIDPGSQVLDFWDWYEKSSDEGAGRSTEK